MHLWTQEKPPWSLAGESTDSFGTRPDPDLFLVPISDSVPEGDSHPARLAGDPGHPANSENMVGE